MQKTIKTNKTPQKKLDQSRIYKKCHRQQINIREKKYYYNNTEKMRKIARKSWQKNKKNRLKRAFVIRQNIKKIVLQEYSSGKPHCSICNFKDLDCLEVDRINNDGKKDRDSGLVGPKLLVWLIKNNYPKGYQVLCRNCNWKKYIINLRKIYVTN